MHTCMHTYIHTRAALTEGDQLMSSPPLFSPAIKKEIRTDGELLTFTWSFHFKMCMHKRIHIYIYISKER